MVLSQAGLSRRLKVNQSTISRVETGSKRMTRNLLYKLRERISDENFQSLKEVFDEWERNYRAAPCTEGQYRETANIGDDEGPGLPEAQRSQVH